MKMTSLLVPTFIQMLSALSVWLDKAVDHERMSGMPAGALLSKRLADDMFALSCQVRFACFQALEPTFLLRGEALPAPILAIRQEGWEANQRPGSFAEAQARLVGALSLLSDLPADALDGSETMPIALELANGMIFDMTGEQYVRDWSLPQFHFHLDMAYAILRSQGVPLGKTDYVAHALAYLRPGTMPSG